MTIITTTSIILTAALAFLIGRCFYISNLRAKRLATLKDDNKKLRHRLDYIADSSKYDRFYEIEEDELSHAYNVNLKVYVHTPATPRSTPSATASSSHSHSPTTKTLPSSQPKNSSTNSTKSDTGKANFVPGVSTAHAQQKSHIKPKSYRDERNNN